ncbi:hypothetical protein [Cellvibrio japonicus]|uniref:Uncharacterized protein n=1 Tax=Cellvibrio japonicus (strain Ueda107) TaxID=498211 RepID=B3PKR7_CELJU|nr:hypothetical protein [Cellvibrio japonicus]ACE85643.1 hypothetical protein CJA_0824 [Cellvibrio japonicus Ueda107]QEI11480.1 hypothetical protein FY117_04030 [Cellvibrio japonicus]QEI15054.1 hypothetical protein FY116_04030 [Cellvibrio japonicus]QEI18634.1 hypothetical protein FY115_04030 [Cellvibrio japonicus]
MSRIFKEIDLCAKRPLAGNDKKIEYMSRVVCALFVKGMPKTKTEEFWKLSIRFNDSDNSGNNKILLGVLVVNHNFPADDFLSWPNEKQQHFMLDFVSSAVHHAFIARGMDVSFIETARKYVENHNFLNVFEGKLQASPFENTKARIVCEQEMQEARIYMQIGRGKSLEKYLIDRCAPDEFHIQIYFGRIDWVSQEKLVLNMIGNRKIEVIRET